MEFVTRIARRQDGVVTRGQALAAGVPGHQVDSLCSSGRWRMLAPDAYLVVDGAVPRRALIRATVLALGPGAVVALGTAAELHGMAGLPPSDEIHVALPSTGVPRAPERPPSRTAGSPPTPGGGGSSPETAGPPASEEAGARASGRGGLVLPDAVGPLSSRRSGASLPVPPVGGGGTSARVASNRGRETVSRSGGLFDCGVRFHRAEMAREDVHRVAGIPVSSPLRTATDLLLCTPRYPAVAMLDAGLRQGLFSAAALAAIPARIRGRPGAAAARRHLADADGRAGSPLETRVRLRAADGGVGPTDLQYVTRDLDGGVLAVADLAWPGSGLLAEADGLLPHGSPQALHEDRRRQNRLAHAGWRVLRFTWADTRRADYIPFVVRSALSCPVPRPPSAMAESWGR